jgi:hypothetical protein
MKPLLSVVLAGLIWTSSTCVGWAQDARRLPGEDDLAFAARALRLPKASEPKVTAALWNGRQTLFVEYLTPDQEPERPLVALLPDGAGYRSVQVTIGEQEGGTPDIAAIGFANADRDPVRELIVILAWQVNHYDVGGTAYEVRIFDDAKPGEAMLTPLNVDKDFAYGCACGWRDGREQDYRYKTIASVKARLRALGY